MRNNNPMETKFWQRAYEAMPNHARSRYAFHMKAAERWELRLNFVIEAVARAKSAVGRLFQEPRPQH